MQESGNLPTRPERVKFGWLNYIKESPIPLQDGKLEVNTFSVMIRNRESSEATLTVIIVYRNCRKSNRR